MRTRLLLLIGVVLSIGLAATSSVAAADDTVTINLRLTGAKEVPAADPDGTGKAKLHIDAAGGQICFDIKDLTDTGAPNRGHIHKGPIDGTGGIVITFFELRPTDAPASDPRHDELEAGGIQGCVSADPTLLGDLVANPQDYYLNVHNTRFPAGSLRCQLEE